MALPVAYSLWKGDPYGTCGTCGRPKSDRVLVAALLSPVVLLEQPMRVPEAIARPLSGTTSLIRAESGWQSWAAFAAGYPEAFLGRMGYANGPENITQSIMEGG